MCVISGPVKRIKNTKIFVAPLKIQQEEEKQSTSRQITIYSNEVHLKSQSGVMILPFPNYNQLNYCEFVESLSKYPNLFNDLEDLCLPRPMAKGIETMALSANSTLRVQQVGSYKATVVPSLGDLQNIDSNVFEIDPKVVVFLSEQYSKNFGFVVCKLDQDKAYHPFGYCHCTLEDGRLFIPTMHYHAHDDEKTSVDWDHHVYTANTKLEDDVCAGRRETVNDVQRISRLVKFNFLPSDLMSCREVTGYRIYNYHENHDLHAVF